LVPTAEVSASFDHLVSAAEQRQRDRDAQCLCGLEIDDQFNLGGLAGIEGDPGAQIVATNSTISHNNIGVQSFSSVRLRNTNISFNNTAVTGASGSLGGNSFSGNSSVGTAPTPIAGAPSDIGP
jgi:hypothetical protein